MRCFSCSAEASWSYTWKLEGENHATRFYCNNHGPKSEPMKRGNGIKTTDFRENPHIVSEPMTWEEKTREKELVEFAEQQKRDFEENS